MHNHSVKGAASIVKVSCSLLKQEPHQILFITAFKKKSSIHNNIVRYENETPNFYSMDNISHLVEVKILDEEKKFLRLKRGHPAILHCELIRKRMDQSFSLHISSNHVFSKKLFPKNAPSNFTTVLKTPLDLSGDAYGLSVDSITFPNNFKIFKETQFMRVFEPKPLLEIIQSFASDEANEQVTTYTIEEINLPIKSLKILCKYLTEFLAKHKCKIEHNKKNNKIEVFFKKTFEGGVTRIQFSSELALVLGCKKKKIDADKYFTLKRNRAKNVRGDYNMQPFDLEPNLTLFFPALILIYSDIVFESPVGNTHAPLVGIFSVHKSNNEYITERVKSSIFHKIRTTHITAIDFYMRDISGEEIAFRSDKPIFMTITFKKL